MSRSFTDLVGLFDGLQVPRSNVGLGRFFAHPVPGFTACAVGKDATGKPVLLVQADNAQGGVAAPVVLDHISVIHLVSCRVQVPNQAEQERKLSVIRCTENDRAFHEYFLRALHPVIASLSRSPSCQQISEAIGKLADLFRQIAQSPRRTISGLWAELLVIARARDPALLLSSWHATPEDRFDFAFAGDRLDVKAAIGAQRLHHFALEQVRPPGSVRVLVASVLIEPAAGGTSGNDLVDMIRSRIADPDLLIRLDNVVAQTIGQDWRSMQQVRFDFQLATDCLRFVDAAAIPAVYLPLPPELTGVHFRVDLSQHPLPFPSQLVQDSQLFRSAVPG